MEKKLYLVEARFSTSNYSGMFLATCEEDAFFQSRSETRCDVIINEVDPCDKCGANVWMHVQGAPDELSGYECHECGKGFIPDKVQQSRRFESLPIDTQEYLEYLSESEA